MRTNARIRFMDAALAMARTGLGRTAPNPSVGCLLVRDGAVVGRGRTGAGGRPHAERLALDEAGELARGATAFVTLEPCSHTGVTGPCADALIEAGIAVADIACPDPDPRVSGRGVARLEAAGVTVRLGLRRSEAEALNAGFFTRLRTGRPLVAADWLAAPYDADLACDPQDDLMEALAALGRAGATRVRVAPCDPLAMELRRAGLLDHDVQAPHTSR